MSGASTSRCIRGCCEGSVDVRLDVRGHEDLGAATWQPLATGGTSRVMQGTYRGQHVAVKLPTLPKQDDLDRFHKELQMMLMIDHPHVVPLLAARAHPPDYCFVLPLLHCNLAQAVYDHAWRPAWPTIVRLGIQLASALCYLHELGLVHRDLKPANVLLDHDGTLKLTDLGISETEELLKTSVEANGNIRWAPRGKPSGGFHKQLLAGTLEYMAPEVLQKRPSSRAADVFAFAIVLNEIATGVVPYSDCTKDNPGCHTVLEMGYGRQELAAAVCGDGLRPILAEDTPEALVELIQRCWELDPDKRPTMHAIHDALVAEAAHLGPETTPPLPTPTLEGGSAAETLAAAYTGTVGQDEDVALAEGALPTPAWGAPVERFALSVRMAAFATAGRRGLDRMEDRHVVAHELGARKNVHLVGVFDGHRGAEAAEFARTQLARRVAAAWPVAVSLSDTLTKAFEDMDAAFCALERQEKARNAEAGRRVEARCAGCTAVAALLYGTTLVVANAGDCRALLCSGGAPVQLTRDHSAECDEERQRIIAFGGKAELRDSWRIGKAAIQVTRSLGDQDVKMDGLTATPEVFIRELTEDDEFLVLACDGLWDTLSNEAVVSIVQDTVKHPTMVAQRLATEAINAGSGDNITVAVLFLQPSSGTLERVYCESRAPP